MNRKEFLQSLFPASITSSIERRPKRILSAHSGPDRYSGPWGLLQAEHLLRRLTFGAKKSDVDRIGAMNMSNAVDQLLAPLPAPNPPVNPATGETFHDRAYDSANEGKFRTYVKSWWLGLMLNQETNITEKLTLFWHNHFVSQNNIVGDSRYMYKQLSTLREYSMGNLKEFAKAITKDPAMLRYLNGNTNVAGKPNENFARELQELFTIGKGPERAPGDYTNYTESDVKAAAQVLTGWKDVSTSVSSTFDVSKHDKTNKQFSSAYQNNIIVGKADFNAGETELNALMDMIFAQPETAKHICRNIYRWFVYYYIDDTVEKNIIEPMANILRSNNYNIKPALETLFKSAHFFDPNNMSCIIKNPVDFVAGAVKDFELTLPDPNTQAATFYLLMDRLRSSATTFQMDLLDPPSVAGWAPYYQEPDYHELWINTVTLPQRNSFTDSLLTGISITGFKLQLDTLAYTKKLINPASATELVSELTLRILGINLTQTQLDYLVQNVLMPNVPSYEWTVIWNSHIASPNDTTKKKTVTDKLNTLYKFIMRMAEYQLA